jgi:GNAT superfamily N-acetyltransferase
MDVESLAPSAALGLALAVRPPRGQQLQGGAPCEALVRVLGDARAVVHVHRRDGVCAALLITSGDAIEYVAVDAAHQRAGVGAALVAWAVRERGAATARPPVECHRGQRLLRRAGFEFEGPAVDGRRPMRWTGAAWPPPPVPGREARVLGLASALGANVDVLAERLSVEQPDVLLVRSGAAFSLTDMYDGRHRLIVLCSTLLVQRERETRFEQLLLDLDDNTLRRTLTEHWAPIALDARTLPMSDTTTLAGARRLRSREHARYADHVFTSVDDLVAHLAARPNLMTSMGGKSE